MIPKRILEKFSFNASGCWIWTASLNRPNGYCSVQFAGRRQTAHRVLYEILRGPIPQGLTLDHLCRNRQCVNPWHCEPVTIRVNAMRGVGISAVNAQKTHCYKGHPFTVENTY